MACNYLKIIVQARAWLCLTEFWRGGTVRLGTAVYSAFSSGSDAGGPGFSEPRRGGLGG